MTFDSETATVGAPADLVLVEGDATKPFVAASPMLEVRAVPPR